MSKKKIETEFLIIQNKALFALFEFAESNESRVVTKEGVHYKLEFNRKINFFDYAVLQAMNSLYSNYGCHREIPYSHIYKLLVGNKEARLDTKRLKKNSITKEVIKESASVLNQLVLTIQHDKKNYVKEFSLLSIRLTESTFEFIKKPTLMDLFKSKDVFIEYKAVSSNVIKVVNKKNKKSYHDNKLSVATKFYMVSKICLNDTNHLNLEVLKDISGYYETEKHLIDYYKTYKNPKKWILTTKRKLIYDFNHKFLYGILDNLLTSGLIMNYKVDKLQILIAKQ